MSFARSLVAYLAFSILAAAASAAPAFTLTVQRNQTCQDESTLGRLLIDGEGLGRTLELPWRNNERGISRIPAGSYEATIRTDGKRGWRLQLKDVADRSYVQVHVGNYQRQIEGCILVGTRVVATEGGGCMIQESRKTLERIRARLADVAHDEVARMSQADVAIRVVVRD